MLVMTILFLFFLCVFRPQEFRRLLFFAITILAALFATAILGAVLPQLHPLAHVIHPLFAIGDDQTASLSGTIENNSRRSGPVGIHGMIIRLFCVRLHQNEQRATLCTTLALGVLILNSFLVLLFGRSWILLEDALLDEGLWIRAVGDLVVELVLEHVSLEL